MPVSPTEISAVVVTKGDRDISHITESLKHFGELLVYDNRKSKDYKVYGRFVGARMAKYGVVYVQDDDTIVDSRELVAQWHPGEVLCNMPRNRRADYEGTGIALIGYGCVFERGAVAVFRQYWRHYRKDELFHRECDRVFTFLNRDRVRLTQVPLQQLSYASGGDRMGREMRHADDLRKIRARLERLGRETMRGIGHES